MTTIAPSTPSTPTPGAHTARRPDPLRVNPIRAAVSDIRKIENRLTPRQREIRDQGRARVDALVASGLYGPVSPRRA